MDNTLEQRVRQLEEKLELFDKYFVVTPTKVYIKNSVVIKGLVNADRVYTARTGTYVELTT